MKKHESTLPLLLALVTAGTLTACDHQAVSGFSVRTYPLPQTPPGDSGGNIVRTVSDIAAKEGMTPSGFAQESMGWVACRSNAHLLLCSRQRDSVYQFRFTQWG